MIFLSLLLRGGQSGYYYQFRADTYYCATREDLSRRINSEIDYSILPTITIDEDLEMDCNDLPGTWVHSNNRKEYYPYYTFRSNSTNGSAVFTLDVSTWASDTCPGFSFSSINLVIKGDDLNTTRFDLTSDVNLKIEKKKFRLSSGLVTMTTSQLTNFSELYFTRLKLLDNYAYNLSNQTFGIIACENTWSEPNVIDIQIIDNTAVTFTNDTLYIENEGLPDLNIGIPIFNYSNAFYFRLDKSNINFSVKGYLNYSSRYPHAFFLIQGKDAKNLSVTIDEGNFMNAKGKYEYIFGSYSTISLSNCNFYLYNDAPLSTLTLSDVNFYPYVPINCSDTFTQSGNGVVYENLYLVCNTFDQTFISNIESKLVPIEGKHIKIFTNIIKTCINVVGDVYLNESLRVPSGKCNININNMYFVNNPILSVASAWATNKNCPINISKNVHGSAKILGTTANSIVKYVCNEDWIFNNKSNSVNPNLFSVTYEGTTIENVKHEVILYEGCISTNLTQPKPTEKITICFAGTGSCLFYDVTLYDDDNWSTYYTPYLKTITFSMTRNTTIDLSILANNVKIVIEPYKAGTIYDVQIKMTQEAADKITELQLGSSTSSKQMTVTFVNSVIIQGKMIVQGSTFFGLKNLENNLYFSNETILVLDVLSQLTNLQSVISRVTCIIINTKEQLTYIEYTNTGWHIETPKEQYDVQGIRHPNITMKITKIPSSTRQLIINCTALDPYELYFAIEYASAAVNVLQLAGDWTPLKIYPLIIGGTITIEVPFEDIPLNFDDRIQYYFKFPRKDIILNKTGRLSSNQILTINSIVYFDITTSLTFSHYLDGKLTIIFANGIDLIKDEIQKGKNEIGYIIREKIILNQEVHRFWEEATKIELIGDGHLVFPNFRDSVDVIWDYIYEGSSNNGLLPIIMNADSLIRAKYYIKDVPMNFSDEQVAQMNHFYLLMTASNSVSFEQIRDKVEFENNSIAMQFENRVVEFETVVSYVFVFEPDDFDVNGIVESENAIFVGLYLRRLDEEELNITQTMKVGLTYKEISAISMGSIAGAVIIGVIIFAFVYNHKTRISVLLSK
ncbi:hypothetical protein TRFO_01925 [Tritrichomonas foetus]|uniref:Uncharacterized protein n=1 Tax=Tritrichomonas foetus TaxID=1144522 RepID=A0A1J4JMT2_9EUKA|nr:hypothetical protein TRFO_01925 [Tritrichomonas foetus]|eukprot:OHS98843.1 hypothetical protein TRFO_01925 [Tritrichomonas foetus]